MSRLRLRRPGIAVPVAVASAAVIGATGLAFLAGEWLAYISLIFGILFFAFAARYYVAILSVLFAPGVTPINGKNEERSMPNGVGNGSYPMVSVHLALYNEERVAERIFTACSKLDYPSYEVVVVDDSNDGTVGILKDWILKQLENSAPKFKFIHREKRTGFKGGALNEALRNTNPKAEYVVVFDADFVPPPDILRKFLAYFNRHPVNGDGNGNIAKNGRYSNGKLAAVQGYQWHTLNRSENWLTRGISCEFSGNYMVDRTFEEVSGVMKMVAGSVYMIRADILRDCKWSTSITEDWEMTLRLYERGHKVLFTPLIQAPGECPSTLGKLVKQRMRWAEGHTYNVKKHFIPVMLSHKVGIREKLEFLYYAPYYLQSLFLILGTFFWLSSDVVLGTRLPFWTASFGWALVFSNLLALPLMSLTGLFFEKRARKDFPGIFSQFLLTYALSPYQAFAALKGLLEPIEGSWVRTFKSGKLAGFPGKLEPRKVIRNVLPPARVQKPRTTVRIPVVIALAISILFAAAAVHGGLISGGSSQPSYYFYNQAAPESYSPFQTTPPGDSFLMHLVPLNGVDTPIPIGSGQDSSVIFFSDPAPSNFILPFGASVSIHIWVNFGGSQTDGAGIGPAPNGLWTDKTLTSTHSVSETKTCESDLAHAQTCITTQTQTATCEADLAHAQTCSTSQTQTEKCPGDIADSQTCTATRTQTETPSTIQSQSTTYSTSTTTQSEGSSSSANLKFRIDIYNPANNSIVHIPGVGETEVFHLQPGLNYYEASWGNIAQGKMILKGETIVATIWCPDCKVAPVLFFNSQAHPSNIDFPIEVPENSLSAALVALTVPGVAGILVERRMNTRSVRHTEEGNVGLNQVQRTLIVAAALIFLTIPLVLTVNDLLANAATATGFDKVVSSIVPFEAAATGDLLRGFGLPAGNSPNSVWIAGGVLPVVAFIDWNCAGWQGFALFGLTSVAGLGEAGPKWSRLAIIAVGLLGTFAVNVLRIVMVVLLGNYVGYPTALMFHDYGGTILMLVWLLAFWGYVLGRNAEQEMSG